MRPYHSVLFLLNTVFFPIYEYPGLLCINKEGLEYTGIRYGMERIKGGKNMVDRCVCCGAIVPEGTEVCINCRHQYLDSETDCVMSGSLHFPGAKSEEAGNSRPLAIRYDFIFSPTP